MNMQPTGEETRLINKRKGRCSTVREAANRVTPRVGGRQVLEPRLRSEVPQRCCWGQSLWEWSWHRQKEPESCRAPGLNNFPLGIYPEAIAQKRKIHQHLQVFAAAPATSSFTIKKNCQPYKCLSGRTAHLLLAGTWDPDDWVAAKMVFGKIKLNGRIMANVMQVKKKSGHRST